jgi:hypothetical protein
LKKIPLSQLVSARKKDKGEEVSNRMPPAAQYSTVDYIEAWLEQKKNTSLR